MKNKKIIEVKNLTRVYEIPRKQSWIRSMFWPEHDNLLAVDNLSFGINEGESVALLGPNGAGKTTTLKMLTGLLHPTSGEIKVMGFTPDEREESFLRQLALVMGNKNGLSWDLSSRHGFKLFQTIYELDEGEMNRNIDELAEVLEVSSCLDRPVRKLSLGQRLKVELIGALIHKPRVLFLDEPTLGLDIIAKRNIRDFLKRRNRTEGTTIILTSHDMADVEVVSDRVMVINKGKLIFDGSMVKLLEKYRNKRYVSFLFERKIDFEKLKEYGEIVEEDKKQYSATLAVPNKKTASIIGEITEKYPVDDIDIKQVPLEEMIADLFKK